MSDEPTCRVCYAKSLSDDERDRFYGEPVTGCIHLCPEHRAAMDDAMAALPHIEFIKARRPSRPYAFPPASPEEPSDARA